MTTDWKALCAELVHGWTEGRDIAGPMANARTALAQPEPEAPTDEELLAIAIESELVASNGTNPFREDSDIEDEVMQFARAVLARWGRPAVEPVTVSERLPGPEDCYRGCCWLWTSVDGLGRWEVQHRDWASASESDYTHWLPHHALPLPTAPTETNGQT